PQPLPPMVQQSTCFETPGLVKAEPRGTPHEGEVSKGELRVLGALSHLGPLSRTRLAIVTGYQHTAGGFATVLASLKARGWVGSSGAGTFVLTEEGIQHAEGLPSPPSGEALVVLWDGKLGKAARASFAVIRASKGPITSQELAEAAGYKAGTGGFADALSELRRYG